MEYEIKDRRRIHGSVFDVEIGTVVLPDGLQLEVTFERNTRKLIIHEWYRLNDEECERLYAQLERDFNAYIDNNVA